MARNVDIRLRRSSVSGNVPTIEQLNLGELAVNTADGKLYLKKKFDGIEQVIEVGADARSGLVSTFNTYIYTSDGTLQNVTGADDYGNFLSYDLASPRRIQVYLNGVLLHQGIDYTAADGETINFVFPIDEGQVVQVAAYNSDGASIDADLILDDGFSFTVGTDEETKLYHNGSNTILKHMAYGDNTFKMMWRDSDRLVMGEDGVAITGHLTINGNEVVTDSDVLVLINGEVTQQYVENLNIAASSVSYIPDSAGDGLNSLDATNVQDAIDILHQEKLDVSALSSSVVFYPTSTVSTEVGGYNKLVTSTQDPDFDTTEVNVNTGVITGQDQLVGQLVSDQGVLEGSTGVINIHTVGNIRKSTGNSAATFYFTVSKMDENGVVTLLSTSAVTRPTENEIYEEFYSDALLESTEFTLTDRVVLRFYASDYAGGADASFEFQFGGATPVRSLFPVPVSVIPLDVRSALSGGFGISYNEVSGEISVSDNVATTTNDFIPDSDNVYTLGSLDKSWKDVFVGPGSLYINGCRILGEDDSSNITFTTDPNQDLILAPGTGGDLIFNAQEGQSIIFNSPVSLTTADIDEDSSSLYHTIERVRQSLSQGSGITYDTTTGEIAVDTNVISTKNYAESYAETYADSQDALTLSSANTYADSQDAITLASANEYTDSAVSNGIELAVIESGLNADSDNLQLKNELIGYIDSQDTVTLSLSTQYADSAINIAITNLVDGAPDVLDTLNEIAAALGDDSDFVGTVQNWINQKLDKTATTDEVTEGGTNKYFTEERARQSISAGNGLSYDPITGRFDIDSDVSFDTVTATTFNGDLNGHATSAGEADTLDGQHGSYYRINVYNATGDLLN